MGNVIYLEGQPEHTALSMGNGLTDTLISALLLSGSQLAKTDQEKRLIVLYGWRKRIKVQLVWEPWVFPSWICPVSYTHLDVYKRQHRHPDRSPGTPRRTVIFLPIFQPKVGNTFYMARRRQEQTHTQRRDRDIDWRGTSHFLPWMVK